MIILGIDPGETLMGYGVLRQSGNKLALIECGCIKIDPGRGEAAKTTAEKLHELETALDKLITKHRPDLAGVEEIFFFKNMKTAVRVAQARGVVLAACRRNGLEVLEFTPLEIKQAVTGYGRAEKKQVQKMIGLILGLKRLITQDDAADAVAAAICAAHNGKHPF